ncbi:MAG: histidinol dehydrogenase [Planctomycetota bacterium]|nr:MAG: histidinol dehydrogenase [Planctomycetota bacterium]
MSQLLPRIDPQRVRTLVRPAFDDEALAEARSIVAAVAAEGETAVRRFAERFGERQPGEPLLLERPAIEAAAAQVDRQTRALLGRVAQRVRAFAEAQLASLRPLRFDAAWGRAGHTLEPVETAGCYAPAGAAPLPSSALMTVIPARVAGVATVVCATPNPSPLMLAAADIAEADAVLCVGGAHAVAAMAFGAGAPRCDMVVGPGGRHVTAAKHVVSARVGIDMLAGPSELLVVADDAADPQLVAADLLAQAEHDEAARPLLIAFSEPFVERVEAALRGQLAALPEANRRRARSALANGGALVAADESQAVELANVLAVEHVELQTRDPASLAQRIRHAGALFLGAASAEVAGDYGAGPNHTLPTGGACRHGAGLSPLTFIRLRTWLELRRGEASRDLLSDAAALARLETLEAHAAAALCRLDV